MEAGDDVGIWRRRRGCGRWRVAICAAVERVHRRRPGRDSGCRRRRPVVSCYEAGRDGFWIHRALTRAGFANRVVDSASIEVNRRARRTKTDRIDAVKLVMMLVRVCCGEPDVWREVRVPSVADEAARHVSRERTALTQEQTRLINQMRSWLATWGCARADAARRARGGRRCGIGPARRCRRRCRRGSRGRTRG